MKVSRQRRLPSIIALSCFESAARHLSFTKAGDELCLTQSAVSRQIKTLESFLGQQLFDRVNQRLALNEVGISYQQRIAPLLDQLDDATRNIQHNISARLNVGIEDALTTKWLIPKLHEFNTLFPDIEIEMITDINQIYREREGYDVGILYGDGQWSEFSAQYLMSEELVAVCAPETLKQYGEFSEFKDILNYPLIHHSSYSSSTKYWLIAAGLTEQKIEATPGAHFENFRLIVDAAKHKLGITVVARYFVEQDLKDGTLVLACTKPLVSNDNYYVVTPKNKTDDVAVQHFSQWLLALNTITSA